MAHKYVYLFSEGNGSMRELLGGKGANLAEMTNLDVYKRQVDMGAALGHRREVVDVGVQAGEVDVLRLTGAAHLGHPFDNVAAGAADTDEQGRGVHNVFLDDFFAHVIPS